MWAWSTKLWPVIWTVFYRHCSWLQSSEMHSISKELPLWKSLWGLTSMGQLFKFFCNFCPTSAGSLRSQRRIQSPVSPTSCRGCLFCCRQVRNGQLRPLMWRAALAGTAVRVSVCSLLWLDSFGFSECLQKERPCASGHIHLTTLFVRACF